LDDKKQRNMSKKKGIIVSGYFNPIHKGHIEYFNNAKAIADELFVIVNNDHQRALKGSKEFQKEEERVFIVSNIKSVNHCILSIDQDRTVCKTIEKIAVDFGNDYELSFANGGDQNNNTIPERPICDQMGITLVDGLGDKIQSSSWLLKK
jgi:cytidyltransferase-like protein